MTMCRRITSQSSTTSMDTLLTGIMLTLILQMGRFLDIKLNLIDKSKKRAYIHLSLCSFVLTKEQRYRLQCYYTESGL